MAEGASRNKQVPEGEGILAWLQGPAAAIYATYFLSSWGDRMWHFGVGLYLVFFDGNELRLAAVYGFVSCGCILLFGGIIGNWVDTNRRIKVVRIALIVQNLSVAVSAAGIAVLLILHESVHGVTYHILAAAVMVLAVVAVLSSCAYKIAIEKDWIVVVASGNSARLAHLNAVTRTVDLLCKALSPMLVGQVMTYGSRLMGAVFIAGWNLFSVIAEYALLTRVYHLVPALAYKQGVDQPAVNANQNGEESLEEKPETRLVELETLVNDDPKDKASNKKDVDEMNVKEVENVESDTLQESGRVEEVKERVSGIRLIFSPCIQLVTGWSVYMRQPVLLAGLALACLYMTVLGFDSITIGYIFSQGVSESVLGICCMLSAVTGIIGTFLYTRFQKCLSLNTTGIMSFSIEVSFLLFSLISIWTPGSPFYLYNPGLLNCTPGALTETRPNILNVSVSEQIANNNESRYRRDLMEPSLRLYRGYQGGQTNMNLLTLRRNPHYAESSVWGRYRRDVHANKTLQSMVDRGVFDLPGHPAVPYGVMGDNVTESTDAGQCYQTNTSKTSVILFLVGIIASRIGLWMADLTVTQLYQEQVVEQERGVVGGVQHSLNMMLDMLKFVAVILLPEIHMFGFLVAMSFMFIFLGLIFFIAHVLRATHRTRHKKQTGDYDASQKNIIYKPRLNLENRVSK